MPERDRLIRALAGGGLELDVIPWDGDGLPGRIARAARDAQAMIVLGGDGSVHHALPALVGAPAALYHYALGTENLFSREFGMRPEPDAVLHALRAGRTREINVGTAAWGGHTRHFAVMLSCGPDAGVIRRLHARRAGAISHLAYIRPVFEELLSPSLPTVTIHADGDEVVRGARGLLLIANMRQYALRIDPAPLADPGDGLLDVVFMPARNAPATLAWVVACRRRRGHRRPGFVHHRARNIRVEFAHETPLQADGEHCPGVRRGETALVGVHAQGVRVLLP